MKYIDKNGNEIKEGMTLRMDDGTIEKVYFTWDQYDNDDLGINASNEEYMRRHGMSEYEREFYSLSNFSPDVMEIIPEKEKTITVLVIEPMKHPEVRQIDNTLEGMQAIVGGLIQPIYPYEDPVSLVCNDEGKLLGLPPNRLLKDKNGEPYDMLCGTFFIAGLGAEDFVSLNKEQINKYTKLFEYEMLIPVKKKNRTNQKER